MIEMALPPGGRGCFRWSVDCKLQRRVVVGLECGVFKPSDTGGDIQHFGAGYRCPDVVEVPPTFELGARKRSEESPVGSLHEGLRFDLI